MSVSPPPFAFASWACDSVPSLAASYPRRSRGCEDRPVCPEEVKRYEDHVITAPGSPGPTRSGLGHRRSVERGIDLDGVKEAGKMGQRSGQDGPEDRNCGGARERVHDAPPVAVVPACQTNPDHA